MKREKDVTNSKFSKTKIVKKWSESTLTSGSSFKIEKLLKYSEPIKSTRKSARKIVKTKKWPPAPPSPNCQPKKIFTPNKKRKYNADFGNSDDNQQNSLKIIKHSTEPLHPPSKPKMQGQALTKILTKTAKSDGSSKQTPPNSEFLLKNSKVGNIRSIFENINRAGHSSVMQRAAQVPNENENKISKAPIGQNLVAGNPDQSELSSWTSLGE